LPGRMGRILKGAETMGRPAYPWDEFLAKAEKAAETILARGEKVSCRTLKEAGVIAHNSKLSWAIRAMARKADGESCLTPDERIKLASAMKKAAAKQETMEREKIERPVRAAIDQYEMFRDYPRPFCDRARIELEGHLRRIGSISHKGLIYLWSQGDGSL